MCVFTVLMASKLSSSGNRNGRPFMNLLDIVVLFSGTFSFSATFLCGDLTFRSDVQSVCRLHTEISETFFHWCAIDSSRLFVRLIFPLLWFHLF